MIKTNKKTAGEFFTLALGFNEDQERDDHGRFAGSGGGGDKSSLGKRLGSKDVTVAEASQIANITRGGLNSGERKTYDHLRTQVGIGEKLSEKNQRTLDVLHTGKTEHEESKPSNDALVKNAEARADSGVRQAEHPGREAPLKREHYEDAMKALGVRGKQNGVDARSMTIKKTPSAMRAHLEKQGFKLTAAFKDTKFGEQKAWFDKRGVGRVEVSHGKDDDHVVVVLGKKPSGT